MDVLQYHRFCESEQQLIECGSVLGGLIGGGDVLHLSGPLGAGKTTFARGVLRGMGHSGAVKSPTYTIVEPYELSGKTIYHVDLYRISTPCELDAMGFESYYHAGAILLIEWPECGQGFLMTPTLEIALSYTEQGRSLVFSASDQRGRDLIDRLQTHLLG